MKNINRIIIAFNKEFKALQEELKETQRFITSMINRVKKSVKGLSTKKQKEYNTSADLFNVYSYIEIYYKIQKAISKDLTGNRKKNILMEKKKCTP